MNENVGNLEETTGVEKTPQSPLPEDTTTKVAEAIEELNVSEFVDKLSDLNKISRKQLMKKVFNNEYQKGFESFFDFLKELGNTKLPIKKDNLLLPLALEYELYLELVKCAQSQENFEDWIDFISRNNHNLEKTEADDYYEKDFTGAGLPRLSDKIENFVKIAKNFLEKDPAKFSRILTLFKETIREIWGENYSGFYTHGTTNAFKLWQGNFWKKNPKAKLLYTPYEYLALPFSVEANAGGEHKNIEVLDLPKLENLTEEDLIDSILEKYKKFRENDQTSPITILVSSEFRAGKKKLDVKKIVKKIREKAPDIHIWIDSAQDNRFFADEKKSKNDIGDLVFYSKRIGGLGKGLVLVNNEKYDENSDLVFDSFNESSGGGISTDNMLEIVGSLFFSKAKILHTIENLTETSGLWYYQGEQTYIENEVKKAEEYFANSEILNEYFDFFDQVAPNEPNEWKLQKIINISPKKDISMEKVYTELQKAGFHINYFGFNLDLNEKVRETEAYFRSSLLKQITPFENEAEFQSNLQENNAFRLFINVLHKPDSTLNLVKKLEEILVKSAEIK